MRKVYLHGRLGKLFGKVWDLDVKSPAEAIHAIQMNKKNLYDYFKLSTLREVGYRIVIGKNVVSSPLELVEQFAEQDAFHFYPVPYGHANGQKAPSVINIIVGIILVIIGAIATYYGGGEVGVPMMLSGAAMIFGGVSALLVRAPDAPKTKPYDGSYLFSGAVNTTKQGGPIPIGYGEMIIGSQTVSLSVRTNRIDQNGNALIFDDTSGPIDWVTAGLHSAGG